MSTSKFAHQAALNDTAAAIRFSTTTPAKIVVGTEVDPLYGVTVKKVYENVSQANLPVYGWKVPSFVDKQVQITEDSISFDAVPGDNAALLALRKQRPVHLEHAEHS